MNTNPPLGRNLPTTTTWWTWLCDMQSCSINTGAVAARSSSRSPANRWHMAATRRRPTEITLAHSHTASRRTQQAQTIHCSTPLPLQCVVIIVLFVHSWCYIRDERCRRRRRRRRTRTYPKNITSSRAGHRDTHNDAVADTDGCKCVSVWLRITPSDWLRDCICMCSLWMRCDCFTRCVLLRF